MSNKTIQKRAKTAVSKEQKNNKAGNVKKNTQSSNTGGFYYSFMTIVLLLCLIQVSGSVVLNVSKIVSYKAKIKQITHTRDAAKALNDQLVDNINNFSNVTGLEAIARNNLKMSSEDEVLVIINTNKDSESETKQRKFWNFKKN